MLKRGEEKWEEEWGEQPLLTHLCGCVVDPEDQEVCADLFGDLVTLTETVSVETTPPSDPVELCLQGDIGILDTFLDIDVTGAGY